MFSDFAGGLIQVAIGFAGRSERDDSRPILFEVSPDSPRIISIMGAKLDNIYDALDAIRLYRWQD